MYEATLTYTPGMPFAPQPIPHATKPATYHRPFRLHTNGDPPSPVHASLPSSPPAQMKLVVSSTKFPPRRVVRSALLDATIGTSTSFGIDWNAPLTKSFLPQPDTQQRLPTKLVTGRQAVAMVGVVPRLTVPDRRRIAMSLRRLAELKFGCTKYRATLNSWTGSGSVVTAASHSPRRTFSVRVPDLDGKRCRRKPIANLSLQAIALTSTYV
uniref:Uncharacterized protein n=1 Tax=Anopheles farauti TaxID=69004 RepID=A0A182QXS8_9DIPT